VVRSRGEPSRELALMLADLWAGEQFTTAMEGLAVRVPLSPASWTIRWWPSSAGPRLVTCSAPPAANACEERKRDLIEAGGRKIFMLLPVVFLMLPWSCFRAVPGPVHAVAARPLGPRRPQCPPAPPSAVTGPSGRDGERGGVPGWD
jgi:hypothetical protein